MNPSTHRSHPAFRNSPVLGGLLAFLAAAPLLAQTTSATPVPAEGKAPRLAALVEKALPRWDESVLAAKPGKDWLAGLDPADVLAAVSDRMPDLPAKPPAGVTRISGPDRSVVLQPERGRAQYFSRARAWDLLPSGKSLVLDREATTILFHTLEALRAPQPEFGTPRVRAQVVQGARTGDKTPGKPRELYRIVTLPRMMYGLPVHASRVLASINAEKQIQRITVQWPAFRVPEKMGLRERKEVVADVVARIQENEPNAELKINAVLSWALRTSDDEQLLYLPSVVVSVEDLPTPYQIIVPVAR